jgi:hypothetical protein
MATKTQDLLFLNVQDKFVGFCQNAFVIVFHMFQYFV